LAGNPWPARAQTSADPMDQAMQRPQVSLDIGEDARRSRSPPCSCEGPWRSRPKWIWCTLRPPPSADFAWTAAHRGACDLPRVVPDRPIGFRVRSPRPAPPGGTRERGDAYILREPARAAIAPAASAPRSRWRASISQARPSQCSRPRLASSAKTRASSSPAATRSHQPW